MISKNNTWWQSAVIYQIYPHSFKDSNGDGIGDLQGIIDKLDYLKGNPQSLDVDAIWISPIYPSPMADFGYDVANYVDIDPMFGDLETFDRLLEEAHQRDLRVILDFVPNHTSDEHPWFIESKSSRDNPKRDWYIWRDAKADGSPPNNWVSMFGGKAWTWDENTEQYYLHLFHTKQPDLNWRNPEVKSAMTDVLRFWLARGVDGFRMDVVGFIIKDEALRDNPLSSENIDPSSLNEWYQLQHKYDVDQPEVHDIIREFRALHDEYDALTIGEIWAEPRSLWVEYYGKNLDGLHVPFNFDLLNKQWDARVFRQSVDEFEAALQAGMWPNYVLGSHDISRLATRCGKAAARVAAMLLLTLRGTPTLYMGDELGMVDGDIPLSKMQDPQGLNLGSDKSRDPCRTPLQWNAEQHAGFSSAEPWLPVAKGYEKHNVISQLDEPHSILNLYRRLLRLRKEQSVLQTGLYRAVETNEPSCFAYLRMSEQAHYLILLNFSNQELSPKLDLNYTNGHIVLSTLMDRSGEININTLRLSPSEGLIIDVRSGQ
jgi:alpha-glucosidase